MSWFLKTCPHILNASKLALSNHDRLINERKNALRELLKQSINKSDLTEEQKAKALGKLESTLNQSLSADPVIKRLSKEVNDENVRLESVADEIGRTIVEEYRQIR